MQDRETPPGDEETIMRTNFYVDEMSHNFIGELPRKVNASKIMRYVLKAIFATDAEWADYMKSDKDAVVVHDYLKVKLFPRLM